MARSQLKRILMRRDRLSEDEADDLINEAKERVAAGEDPDDILHDEFGLEPDYIFDILPE